VRSAVHPAPRHQPDCSAPIYSRGRGGCLLKRT